MLQQNLKNKSVSQTTQNYESTCIFRGSPLAVTGTGLVRIASHEDSGLPIRAWVKSNKFDLGENRLKRMHYFYFGLEGDGNLRLSVYADDILAAQYVVPVVEHNGRQEIRVQIGKGIAARYWAWKVENIDGAFFVLHSVKVLPATIITGQRGN